MSLQTKVTVNTHYTRSVNVERDADSRALIDAYIPTSRAVRTLERIVSVFGNQQAPRAWSLVGPYGSGKSSFAVFLSQLLGEPLQPASKLALSVLKVDEEPLAKRISNHTRGSAGYCRILLTGAPEPLAQRIATALYVAAQEVLGSRHKVVNALDQLQSNGQLTSQALLLQLAAFQDALSLKGYRGVIFIIDELGKFLEYEARHYGANDIYLLQSLAEHACRGHAVNILLFVLLHQSFEQYAKGLGDQLRSEWAKVQGRFEEVPFLESAEQVLRVVAAAFRYTLSEADQRRLRQSVKSQVEGLHSQRALPGGLAVKESVDLFTKCYPLHPVSAMLLPALCQKIAQNERTLFSYLGSQESNGLGDLLKQMVLGEFIQPHHIYDYFITNQPAVIGDHFTHRRWVEVVTALDRLGDADPETVAVLKTIGLLNIVGIKGGLKASKHLLALCHPNASEKRVAELLKKSLVTFRKFSGEFRVWQGSDFDLDEALREEQSKLGRFSLAQALTERKALLPIVARRYTIESGTLRYFQALFVDATNYQNLPAVPTEPSIVFYLATGQDDEQRYYEAVSQHLGEQYITSLCFNRSQLREATTEVLALNQVQINRQELNNDPVAKREFQDRLTAAEAIEDELLQNLLDFPAEAHWHWCGARLPIRNKRQLQEQFSQVLRQLYSHAPVIHNELINRDKPSSQASAARNKLLYAMLTQERVADLGIEKFPPEKAIYRSLLLATGLHKPSKLNVNEWQFCEPPANSANLHPVWARINRFLDETEVEAQSFAVLNQELIAPPYGVKAGILPVLYIAAYIVYQHELALYESRIYRPYFTEEMLDRFVKRPDEFSIQRFRIKGVRASLFKEYSRALHGDDQERTLLDLAKALATEMGRLPEFAQKTEQGIDKRARDVRTAFNLAKSPERLLFDDLPLALGHNPQALAVDDEALAQFAEAFTTVLRELRSAYQRLLDKQRSLLAQAFNLNPKLSLAELRQIVTGYCYGLEHYTVDTQGLRAFIMRLAKTLGSDEEWFENVLMFLGHKPSKKWLDSDQSLAEHRLATFSRGIIDLDKLRLHERDRATKFAGDFDVYLLRSVKKGGEVYDDVVAVDPSSQQYIQHAKAEIGKALAGLEDKELRLAVLAQVVDEFFEESRRKPIDTAGTVKRGRKPKSITGED